MDFITELKERELIQDIAGEERLKKLSSSDSFYNGIDPTAPSLHLGNLIALIVAKHLSKTGAKPIFLFGGATGSIGDPSGKNEERKLLDNSILEENVSRQTKQVKAVLDRLELQCSFVNNIDWTKNLDTISFLRDVGKYFTVNYMMAKESVKRRIEGDGISFTEFSYMLLQAYDFKHLFENESCCMQIGGSDQWGNITAGFELIRKTGKREACALSWPLLTNADGKKFGKSESGAIWLDAELTSPFQLHQYFINTDDADVIKLLKIFTFLSLDEISTLEEKVKNEPHLRAAQNKLADEVCDLLHGKEATERAKKSALVLFGGSVEGISDSEILEIFKDVPSKEIDKTELQKFNVTELFTESGAVKSKGEAKRLIANGGAYINNIKQDNPGDKITETDTLSREVIVLRTGKKSYYLVKVKG